MREFIVAAKALRAAFGELQREIEDEGARAWRFNSVGDFSERHFRNIELAIDIDQLRVVVPVDGKVTGSVRIGDLLSSFDAAAAKIEGAS